MGLHPMWYVSILLHSCLACNTLLETCNFMHQHEHRLCVCVGTGPWCTVLCTHWTCGTFSQKNDVTTFQNVHQVNNSHALIYIFHSSAYLCSAVWYEDWSWKQLCPQIMDNVMMWAMWMLYLDSEKESQTSNQAIQYLTNWIKEFEGDTRNATSRTW